MIRAVAVSILAVFAVSFIGYIGADFTLVTYNITCPEGWSKALNNCYYFNNVDQLSWDEARAECALKDSDLMVVASQAELDWVNIQTESYNTDGWWVGLQYFRGWQWVQYGGNPTMIHWRNEPDNYDEQHCCAINSDGKFSDEFCRSKLGFICSYGVKQGELCPYEQSMSDWVLIDKACYFVSPLLNTNLHMDWKAAQDYCSNLVPGRNCQLLSLYDNIDQRGLMYFTQSQDYDSLMLPWWSGLNDIQTHGEYVWQNGTEADGSLITWVRSPDPDRSKKQNCGLMYQGGSIQDTPCNKRAHYVCERSAIQAQLNLGCPSGWLRGGRSCYLLGNNRNYTWDLANAACSSVNAHLLQVDSLDEKAWVETLPLNMYSYWTGLKRSSDPGVWLWDGTRTSNPQLVKWSVEPNNNGVNARCAEISVDGTYSSNNCDTKDRYICESAYIPGIPCGSNWFNCSSGCYYISNSSSSLTWAEAKDRCSDLAMVHSNGESSAGGHLLAVNDATEQSCINASLAKRSGSPASYWTDLNDFKVKTIWQFSRGADNPPNKQVIPWALEPNNLNNNENCAVIRDGGNYNDYNCQMSAHYICEQPADGTTDSATSGETIHIPRWTLVTLLTTYMLRILFDL